MIIKPQQRHQSISTARASQHMIPQWPVPELTSVQPITTPDSWLQSCWQVESFLAGEVRDEQDEVWATERNDDGLWSAFIGDIMCVSFILISCVWGEATSRLVLGLKVPSTMFCWEPRSNTSSVEVCEAGDTWGSGISLGQISRGDWKLGVRCNIPRQFAIWLFAATPNSSLTVLACVSSSSLSVSYSLLGLATIPWQVLILYVSNHAYVLEY